MQIAGRKLTNILAKAVRTVSGQIWAVIGIGLNLKRPHVPETTPGRGLSSMGKLVDAPEANTVFLTLFTSLDEHLQRFGLQGSTSFIALFMTRDAFAGERVRLWQDGSVVLGDTAHEIDA